MAIIDRRDHPSGATWVQSRRNQPLRFMSDLAATFLNDADYLERGRGSMAVSLRRTILGEHPLILVAPRQPRFQMRAMVVLRLGVKLDNLLLRLHLLRAERDAFLVQREIT